MKERTLPHFGRYVRIPCWFYDYCVPVLSSSAATVWAVLVRIYLKHNLRNTDRPRYEVQIDIRNLARACGLGKNAVSRAVSELCGHELLEVSSRKMRRTANFYSILMYPHEEAALRFKKHANSLSPKQGQSVVPDLETQTPVHCPRNGDTIQIRRKRSAS